MSKAALEREFRRELDSQLRTLGFERCRITWLYGAYFRRVAGVQHVLGIRIEPYFDDLEAEIVSVSVRLNDVEDLVARFEEPHPLVGPEDVAMRSTRRYPPTSQRQVIHYGAGEERTGSSG